MLNDALLFLLESASAARHPQALILIKAGVQLLEGRSRAMWQRRTMSRTCEGALLADHVFAFDDANAPAPWAVPIAASVGSIFCLHPGRLA